MKRKFISFADSRMKKSLARIQRQAEKMDFFDEIEVFTEMELDADFAVENAHLLKPWIRGFGYWTWKPYIIRRELSSLSDGDQLYYIDAGCHLNPAGRRRMFDYEEALCKNTLGVAGFILGKGCSDRAYSKMDMLVRMGVEHADEIVGMGQVCTGHIFAVKGEKSLRFMDEWYDYTRDVHLIDDSPSVLPNFPEFIEHRHEQSVFSILCKLRGAVLFPGRETWPANNSRDWSTMQQYPIWDKRDLGITTHLITRTLRKIRKLFKQFRPIY